MTSVKLFKQENQQSNVYKKLKTRNTYEPHKQTTFTEQLPDLRPVQTNAVGLNVLTGAHLHPYLKQWCKVTI